MTTLEGKTIVVVGGSSGIGFAVVKASLLSGAEHVKIVSSNPQKVTAAVERAKALGTSGAVTGDTLDLRDSKAIKAFFEKLGALDHLVITSGGKVRLGFPNVDLDAHRDLFDLGFWSSIYAAQSAKIKEGGSITLTSGAVIVKPLPGWTLMAGFAGALDSLTRGLAVDLAPVRVNIVSPGLVKTENWDDIPAAARDQMFAAEAAVLPVKHIAEPAEIAEAYLFLMKCSFITGTRIDVDGGVQLAAGSTLNSKSGN